MAELANYNLYGDLLLGPPNFNFKSSLLELDIWSDDQRAAIEACSDDDIGSEHYSTFGLTVFPFGHYYTSPVRNYAGNDAPLMKFYADFGFDFEGVSYGMGPTHIGTQLKFLHHLRETGKMHEARFFLDNFILNWIHSLAISLSETNGLVYPTLVRHIENLVIEEWTNLNGSEHTDEFHFQLTPYDFEKDLLENEKTSLKDIGEVLMTPGLCGVFISKPTLTSFASQLEIPTGFGTRVMMMENIFKEAVNYEKIDKLVSMFDAYFSHWEKSYTDYPVKPVADVWVNRIHEAKVMLKQIQENLS